MCYFSKLLTISKIWKNIPAASLRRTMQFECPALSAKSEGVIPFESLINILASCCSKTVMLLACPCSALKCNGVCKRNNFWPQFFSLPIFHFRFHSEWTCSSDYFTYCMSEPNGFASLHQCKQLLISANLYSANIKINSS